MLATLCSKPAATNADMGKMMAKILSTTLRAGQREPDGQADQNVAHDTFEEGLPERQRCLCGGNFHGVDTHRIARSSASDAIAQTSKTRPKRAGQIGEIDDEPISHQFFGRNPMARPGHDQQVVAGE